MDVEKHFKEFLVEFLNQNPEYQNSNIVFWGVSYGATVAMLAKKVIKESFSTIKIKGFFLEGPYIDPEFSYRSQLDTYYKLNLIGYPKLRIFKYFQAFTFFMARHKLQGYFTLNNLAVHLPISSFWTLAPRYNIADIRKPIDFKENEDFLSENGQFSLKY